MERLKEILIMVAFMVAIVLFPWLAFLMIRSFATFVELDPASVWGNIISIFPNIIMFGIAFVFLKMDDWDFKAIGFNWKRILPGFVFIVLTLIGLYVFVPMIMSIFYEPRTLIASFDQKVVDAFFNTNKNMGLLFRNPDTQNYIINLFRSWFVVGLCEEIAARGYLLNKFYSILPNFPEYIKVSYSYGTSLGLTLIISIFRHNTLIEILGNLFVVALTVTLLNLLYKIFTPKIRKKIVSVLFISLFFTLVGYIRSKAAGNQMVTTTTLLVIFSYSVLICYVYLKTKNIFIGIFMQAALDFPPFGLTVNKMFAVTDFGFLFSMACLLVFIILLAETYPRWGQPLEFEKRHEKNPAD